MAYSELQHSAVSLELEAAHRWSRGEGASVVIVDTGADIAHPEIRAQVKAHRNFVDESATDFIADAHGTAIAGIIGASADDGTGVVGVAPSAAITVLKACWYASRQQPAVCNSFTLARALSFAIESDAQVINLSLSGPEDPLLTRLVAAAVDSGQIVIAAAPAAASGATFPAELPGVIVVDAAETTAPDHGVSVRAPGSDILVLVPGGEFGFANGSSLSAAHVSGVVALLVSSHPRLSRDAVSALLISAEDPDSRSISACRALALLMDREGCPGQSFVSGRGP
jgi:subtilisin family serine protease